MVAGSGDLDESGGALQLHCRAAAWINIGHPPGLGPWVSPLAYVICVNISFLYIHLHTYIYIYAYTYIYIYIYMCVYIVIKVFL